jgi:hypothetical protein
MMRESSVAMMILLAFSVYSAWTHGKLKMLRHKQGKEKGTHERLNFFVTYE